MSQDFKKTLNYIEDNLNHRLSVKELSEHNFYSNSHYNRLFLYEMGNSITKYIRMRRVIRSSQMLILSSNSVTDIALDCGFTNIDTYIRNFKSTYGVTPTDFRKVKSLTTRKIEGEYTMMLTMFESIKDCSKEDRLKGLDQINNILSLSKVAHNKGLFSLEEQSDSVKSPFLSKAIELIVDGISPEIIRNILENYIKTTKLEPKEVLERLIYLEGMLLIQQGRYPWEIRLILISLLGENLDTEIETYFKTRTEIKTFENRFLEQTVVISKNLHLENEIKDFNPRRLQRILRECDQLEVVVASYGLCQKSRTDILACLSIRTRSNFIELYSLLDEVSLAQIVDAQNDVLEIIQKLRLSNDI